MEHLVLHRYLSICQAGDDCSVVVVILTQAQVGMHSLVERLLGHLHWSSLCLRVARIFVNVGPSLPVRGHLLSTVNKWVSSKRGW